MLGNAPSNEEQAKMYGFHEQSTIPIVKINKNSNIEEEMKDSDNDSSSSSSDPDEDLYMEFDSSDEDN